MEAVLADKALSGAAATSQVRAMLKHVQLEEIPASEDLFSNAELESYLSSLGKLSLSVLVVGDIMLGQRIRGVIGEYGPDYPFRRVLPVLRRSHIIVGNLEGPFARKAQKQDRNHSYKVKPELAAALSRAGINVVTLANNHLLDCGRPGVTETLEALAAAGVAALGAGADQKAAHAPVILEAGGLRIGLLGYYWNSRCAATSELPGSAMDPPEALEEDIGALRKQVDRTVVTFHWGVPYEREPSLEDRAKARFAVDCGADAVVGHHPHIVQPFEIYRGCPIFYSVGNFTFGSGNSRAEGLMLGLQFEDRRTTVNVFPLYLKNRDPRVNYQPRVLRGKGAKRVLGCLAEISGANGRLLKIESGRGTFELPYSDAHRRRGEPSCG
jgi:poly-gamma-glutamate capsule biosynthesis protein CapA/YwtB (metallophosphatase superfamily)